MLRLVVGILIGYVAAHTVTRYVYFLSRPELFLAGFVAGVAVCLLMLRPWKEKGTNE